MGQSIFENRYGKTQVWNMQGAIVLFGGTEAGQDLDNSFIVSSLEITYGRPVQKLYPINMPLTIMQIGIPDGSIRMGVMFGPGNALRNFIDMFQNPCNSDHSITLIPFGKVTDCESKEEKELTGKVIVVNPVLVSIGMGLQAATPGQMGVNSSANLMFSDMQLD